MAVTLSESAARHVSKYLAKRGRGVGVRLGVKTTGCSGLAYKLEYVDEIAPEDIVFEGHGVKVTYSGTYTTKQGGTGKEFTLGVTPKPIDPIVAVAGADGDPF